MLVVGRKNGEAIIVDLPDGSQLTITALGRKNGQNKLGIEAPASVKLRRAELAELKGGRADG